MDTRTLLIDGSALLKRSFNGSKNSYTKAGFMGGLYGFITKMRQCITRHAINKCVVMWDGEQGGIQRYHLDHAYKANRKSKSWHIPIQLSESELKREKEKEASILWSRKRVQSYCEELFVRQIEVYSIEADDLIASYCMTHYENEEIFILTNDRDFSQFFDLGVTILFFNIEVPVNKSNYSQYFNHHYSNALNIKIICGDTADNIAGIEGIGEKTLLKYFPDLLFRKHTVNEICEKSALINEEKVKKKKKPIIALENIVNGKQRLILNHKLTNLRKPFLNDEAFDELLQLEMPLSSEGRGSKPLLKMMMEDEFLTLYNSDFVSYVQPFYTVITREKDLLKKYNKENKIG